MEHIQFAKSHGTLCYWTWKTVLQSLLEPSGVGRSRKRGGGGVWNPL